MRRKSSTRGSSSSEERKSRLTYVNLQKAPVRRSRSASSSIDTSKKKEPEPEIHERKESATHTVDISKIEEHTKNCRVVPREQFGDVKIGDRVFYLRSDNGRFSQGGYIQAVTSTKIEPRSKLFVISFTPSGKGKRFTVLWDNIETLWRKVDAEINRLFSTVEDYADKKEILGDIAEYLYMQYGEEFARFMRGKAEQRRKKKKKASTST